MGNGLLQAKSILNHLKRLDIQISSWYAWLPGELTRKSLMDRISTYESTQFNRDKIGSFLKRLVNADKSRSLLATSNQNCRSWGAVSRHRINCNKGFVLFEWFIEESSTMRFSPVSLFGVFERSSCPEVASFGQQEQIVFQQNNISLVTCQTSWQVLMRSPYNPKLAPSDYHLFLCMAKDLAGIELASYLGKFIVPIGP